jgi:hypothetical protein
VLLQPGDLGVRVGRIVSAQGDACKSRGKVGLQESANVE